MTQFVNPKKIYPLREKRRNNTRAVLVKTCNKLLNENGYRNITMQNVADVAGIHVQTLYKHFPTKFSLASSASCEALRGLMRDRKTDTFAVWKSYVLEKAEEISSFEQGEFFLETVDSLSQNEQLTQLQLAIGNEYIEILKLNIALDLSMDKEKDLMPKLIANLIYTTNTHNTEAWIRSGGRFNLVESSQKMLSQTLKLINSIRSSN
tara:strand:- start:12208 stop:12828 length:621 start_codon:yes stop_codon:yes gene_type:complete